jgi:hypothetical protein
MGPAWVCVQDTMTFDSGIPLAALIPAVSLSAVAGATPRRSSPTIKARRRPCSRQTALAESGVSTPRLGEGRAMNPLRIQPGAGVMSDRPKPAFTVSPRRG